MIKKLFLISALFTPFLCFPKNQVPELTPAEPAGLFKQTQKGITLTVSQYDLITQTTKYKIKRQRYETSPFYPMEITVKNEGDTPITLNPQSIDLQLIESKQLTTLLSRSSTVKAICAVGGIPTAILIGAGVLTVASIPLVFAGGHLSHWVVPVGLALLGYGVIGIGIALGLATVCAGIPLGLAYKSRVNKNALARATLTDAITINPGEQVTKLIFVAEQDFASNFTVAFDQATFDVQLA